MGNCSLCGQPAGILKTQHRECTAIRDRGWAEMLYGVRRAAAGKENLDNLEARLASIADRAFIPKEDIRKVLVEGWEVAVEQLLEDSNLDCQEENALMAFKERFSLSQDELDHRGAFSRVVKGAILRDLLEGKVRQRVEMSGGLPFNFQKNEQLIYLFPQVEYLEDKIRTQYVGGYQGVSIRVMKGVYYRVGGFKGNPIQRTERVHVDTGSMGVTNKHIYFSGPSNSFRVQHNKIVTFLPFK